MKMPRSRFTYSVYGRLSPYFSVYGGLRPCAFDLGEEEEKDRCPRRHEATNASRCFSLTSEKAYRKLDWFQLRK
jgi:hypothetical protein